MWSQNVAAALSRNTNVKDPGVFAGLRNRESVKAHPKLGVSKFLRVPTFPIADLIALARIGISLILTSNLFGVPFPLFLLHSPRDARDPIRDLRPKIKESPDG